MRLSLFPLAFMLATSTTVIALPVPKPVLGLSAMLHAIAAGNAGNSGSTSSSTIPEFPDEVDMPRIGVGVGVGSGEFPDEPLAPGDFPDEE